jgi:hypothetical protein
MFMISRPNEGSIYVHSIDQIDRAIQSCPPGRYDIDKIGGVALSSDDMPRRWGVGIRRQDGFIELERDQRDA